MKKIAFTLAETLIVMGIIGVVAALTLPNLNSSTGDKEKVAKVKKIYSNLQDAFGRAETIYGPIDEWEKDENGEAFRDTSIRMLERTSEFLKVTKTCAVGTNQKSCINITDDNDYQESYVGSLILADGTSVAFLFTYGIYRIWIDIDGINKGAHTPGNDIFYFYVDNQTGSVEPNRASNFTSYINNLKSGGSKKYASGWIIDYDNADYLKFNTSGQCPNGTTPTEANPRCK